MLLNLSFMHQQEVAIHLFHNFIPHNACKMLEVRVIKEFNFYELRAKLPPLPPLVKGKGGNCPRCPRCPRGSGAPARSKHIWNDARVKKSVQNYSPLARVLRAFLISCNFPACLDQATQTR